MRGVWITETDTPAAPGDAVAFLELDPNGDTLGYRPQVGAGSPFTLVLSNDPAAGEDQRGKTDNVFVDQDTGDLIIIESGFNDSVPMASAPTTNLGCYVSRWITTTAWARSSLARGGKRKFSIRQRTRVTTFLERGHWSAYDSAKDTVWFFNPVPEAKPLLSKWISTHLI